MSFSPTRILRLWAVVVIGFCGSLAQADTVQEWSGKRLHEDLRAEALISGNWLVGAHIVAAKTDVTPVLLSHVPGDRSWQGKTICVRATDKTGRYSALFEFDVPGDWTGGLVSLKYHSKYRDFVEATDENNNGIALHRGDCNAISETFLPVHWNASAVPETGTDGSIEMLLNLNMGRTDSVIAKAGLIDGAGTSRGEAPIACAPTDAIGVGFNYQCRIRVPGNHAGAVEVSFVRLRYGKKSPPRVARIEFRPTGLQ